jgi:hypothetical protein
LACASMRDEMSRGGYLGTVKVQDPVELLATGEL